MKNSSAQLKVVKSPFDGMRVSLELYPKDIAIIENRILELESYLTKVELIPNLTQSELIAFRNLVKRTININLQLLHKKERSFNE